MRSIKFRALFDGVWHYQTLDEMLDIRLAAFRMGKHKTQYTGLHDRNGKEIYEGDRDQHNDVIDWCERRNGWGAKVWDFKENKPIMCHCYMCEGHFELNEFIEDIEIIGNIYENPELLNT